MLLGVPLLDVVSFGPVAWVALRTGQSASPLIMLPYAPLGFAGEAVRSEGEFLMWYANLFPLVGDPESEPAPTPASPPAGE